MGQGQERRPGESPARPGVGGGGGEGWSRREASGPLSNMLSGSGETAEPTEVACLLLSLS